MVFLGLVLLVVKQASARSPLVHPGGQRRFSVLVAVSALAAEVAYDLSGANKRTRKEESGRLSGRLGPRVRRLYDHMDNTGDDTANVDPGGDRTLCPKQSFTFGDRQRHL